MFGIGETELVIIVVFGFLLFGPDKLPGMGRTIGRALRQFREAQEGFTQVVQAEVMDPLNDAMNAPAKKASLDEDSDIEGTDAEVAARKSETFAERKARLKAERDARAAAEKAAEEAAAKKAAEEAAAAEEAEPEQTTPAEDGGSEDVPVAVTAEETSASDPESQEDSESSMPEEEPAPNSVAALYATVPSRRARKNDSEAKSASGQELVVEQVDAAEPKLGESDEASIASDATDGKEDEGEA